MSVGSTERVHLIVQADRGTGFGDDGIGGLADWRTVKRLRVLEGELDEVEDLGEKNMGNEATLEEFVSWGLEQYPAEKVALVMRDRGAGWAGFGSDASTATGDRLTLAELEQGIQGGLVAAGREQLDLIGLDASLMATWEVASTLAPLGGYLLASQDAVPGHGWDYGALGALTEEPGTDPQHLGLAFVQAHDQHAAAAGAGETATLSLIDLSEMDGLDRAIGDLASDIENDAAAVAVSLARARRTALVLGGISLEFLGPGLVDLQDLLSRLAEEDGAWFGHAGAIDAALADAVVARAAGRAMETAGGLSIYFPVVRGLLDEDYEDVAAAEDWRAALGAFYDAAAEEGVPAFTNEESRASFAVEEGTLVVWGDLDEATVGSIAGTEIWFGTSVDETILVLGDDRGVVDEEGLQAGGAWNLSYLVLFDEEQAAYAYASWSFVTDEVVALTVPLVHESDGGERVADAFLYVIYERGGGVLESKLYETGVAGVAELVPREDSRVRPIIRRLGEDVWEWVYSTPSGFDPTDPALDFGFLALEAGDMVFVQIRAENAAGAAAGVYLWAEL